jgi:hypothetical protein
MKTRIPFISLALTLFFLIVCGPLQAYGAGRIDLVVDRGTSRDVEAAARAAIEATNDFFKKVYGLTLERKVEIFLVPDRQAHIKELKQRYSLTETEAASRAQSTSGSALDGIIIVNAANTGGKQGLFFCLCHELVHYFQGQVSRNFCAIMWLTEGTANVLAAQIMAAAGVQCLEAGLWPEVLKRGPGIPRLEHLHSFKDWGTTINSYGQATAYAVSSMAVVTLIRAKGNKPLFAFFQGLNKAKPEDAFYQAFGVKLADFEKNFRPY